MQVKYTACFTKGVHSPASQVPESSPNPSQNVKYTAFVFSEYIIVKETGGALFQILVFALFACFIIVIQRS